MEAQKVERSNAARYGVRRVSWQGIASSILLIIQIILLFSAVYLSYLAEGKGGLIVGILESTQPLFWRLSVSDFPSGDS